jgi:hypothetical protein
MAVTVLPTNIQALHNTTPDNTSPPFTFVFHGKIAGLPGTMIWDSAATLNFISSDCLERHRLRIFLHEHGLHLNLADGKQMQSPGFVKVHLRIQKFSREENLVVTDLTPGFDVLLGDEWSVRNSIVADYGYQTDKKSVEPSLWLRKSNVKLCHNRTKRIAIPANDNGNAMISAVQAFRLLSNGPKVDTVDRGGLMLQDPHLQKRLQQVLKLNKEKWEEAREHALKAIVVENRMRV